MVSFVVAMNRVDVVDLVVDLVDVDLDVDLVDVDLEVDLVDVVSLSSGCIFIFWPFAPRLYLGFLPLRLYFNLLAVFGTSLYTAHRTC